jgi:hypothetical protein
MKYSGTEMLPVAEHGLDRPFLLMGAQRLLDGPSPRHPDVVFVR